MRFARRVIFVAACIYLLLAASSRGQDEPAIMRGVQFLRSGAATQGTGESALAGLALLKAKVPVTDQALQTFMKKVDSRFDATTYTPERSGPGGYSIYEAGVVSMFYANLDSEAYRPRLESIAQYIIGNQLPRGGWDYAHRTAGDCSITQYGVLGLWEAENAGVAIPPKVWESAARFYLGTQDNDGGWRYHPDEGGVPTVSMTAAGVGSLLICQRQLEMYRGGDSGNPLLKPLVTDPNGFGSFDVTISNGVIDGAVKKGLAWIAGHFQVGKTPVMGQSVYYGLYGMERIGALSGRKQISGIDWYDRGRSFILSSQEAGGRWNAQHGDFPNTSWAILFLTKSTEQSVRKIEIKRLGAGTLIGGRGLPKDLSSLTIAGGRVLAQPMNGAIESMLSVLEDPRAEQADSALAGLVARYRVEGETALRPHQERFRKLLTTDPDPGIRGVAAWALARTADLTVVPDLIGALEDPDELVVAQARGGLQLMSRKIEGYGPEPGSDAAARAAAAQRWRAWYDTVKPPDYSLDRD